MTVVGVERRPGLPPLFRRAPMPVESWPARYIVATLAFQVAEAPARRISPGYSLEGYRRNFLGAGLVGDSAENSPTWVDPIASWRPRAICTTTDPAKATCLACPVRWLCLEWALKNEEPTGRWGGYSTMGRQRLLAEHGGDPVEALIAAWQAEHPEVIAA